MVTANFNDLDGGLAQHGFLEAAMPEPVQEVLGGVQAYLTNPELEPLLIVVFHHLPPPPWPEGSWNTVELGLQLSFPRMATMLSRAFTGQRGEFGMVARGI